jgi:hypothetical protein
MTARIKVIESYCELCKRTTIWERDITQPSHLEFHCLGDQTPPHYTSVHYLAEMQLKHQDEQGGRR